MKITGLVASYQTFYGGEPNRIHNVQLVSHLVDNHVIAPGATFSFNQTTGARTAEKGFREAPVIINGELQTGLGGGVCQVSTTVFNAAYEAGLPIVSRTNHALYISHYPQGRDATVNYPDTDLKFTNDTGNWLLAAHVGRLVVADGRAVRHAGASPRRQRDGAASRDGAGADEEDLRPDAAGRRPRGRGERRAVSVHERPPPRLRREGEAPVRHDLLLLVPRRGSGRPSGHEAEAETRADSDHDDAQAVEARHDDVDADYDNASALAIASARA